MDRDDVIINQNLSGIYISEKTLSFFRKYKINYLKASSFPMNFLRQQYKTNKNEFYYIVNELSLLGCDFITQFPNTIFPKPIGRDFDRLYSDDINSFSIKEIVNSNLTRLITEYDRQNKKALTGISIKRLNLFVKKDVTNYLKDLGFEIKSSSIINNKINEIEQKHVDSKSPCVPTFYLKFISSLWVCDEELYFAYNKLGVFKYIDFLNLKSNECKKYVNVISEYVSNAYLKGIYITSLCIFLKEKDEFKKVVSSYDLDPKDFFLNDFAINMKDYLPLKEHFMFSFFDSKCLISEFKETNKNYNLHISSMASKYLSLFSISDIFCLKKHIFSEKIDYYKLLNRDDYLFSRSFNPFIVLLSIECSVNNTYIEDENDLNTEFEKMYSYLYVKEFNKCLINKFNNPNKLSYLIEAIKRRDRGETLESIAKEYKITRERIRQIAASFAKKYCNSYLKLLDNVINDVGYLSIPDCFKIIGLVQFLDAKTNNSNYAVDYDLGIIANKQKLVYIKSYIEKNKYNASFDIFNSVLNFANFRINFSGYLLNSPKNTEFNPYPIFPYSIKVTAVNLSYQYLREKGIKGFDANKDIDELKEYFYKNNFNDKDLSDRVAISRLQRCDTVLVGMSRYACKEFVTKEMKTVAYDVLKKYKINKNYGTVIKEIYFANESVLNKVGIDNYYFLYGLGSKFKMCNYNYSGRGMRLFIGKEKSLEQIINKYFDDNGPIVDSKKIMKDLCMREVGFESLSNISKFDSNSYILTSFIKCNNYQKTKLFYLVDSVIKNNGFCLGEDILKSKLYFDNSFNEFFKVNKITTPTRAIYALKIIAKKYNIKKFVFSSWIDAISLPDNPIMTIYDVIYTHFKGNPFSKNSLLEYLRKIKVGGEVTIGEFFKKYTVRVGSDSYIISKEFSVNDDDMEKINKILNESYKNNLFITANEVIYKLTVNNIKHHYLNNPIGLCSAISFYKKTDWIKPKNNLSMDNNLLSKILINKRYFDDNYSLSNLILKFVLEQETGYMSYNDVIELLEENEIISRKLTYENFKEIFDKYLDSNGLLNITKK